MSSSVGNIWISLFKKLLLRLIEDSNIFPCTSGWLTKQQDAMTMHCSCSLKCRPSRHVIIATTDVRFRNGSERDMSQIRRLIASERMNLLALDPARFVVATNTSTGTNDMIAAGQLVPLQNGAVELRSMVVQPSHRSVTFPLCLFTPQPHHILHRRKGVGSALLAELLDKAGKCQVYITTVASRSAFYERAGFVRLPLYPSAMPAAMWFEVAVGLVIARVLANEELIVMKLTP